MKIAISCYGKDLDALVDPRFGRCRFFVVVDLSTEEFEAVDNQAAEMSGGAGIQAAQMVINLDIDAVITGSVGPNAADTLAVAGVKAYLGASTTVREALRQYRAGKLQESLGTGGIGNVRGPGGGVGRGRGLGRGRGGGTGRGVNRKGGGMDLLEQVKEGLSRVVHSETGMDVIRMKQVRNLKVHKDGKVELTFRPYSMFCSIGFRQGIKIKKAVKSVPRVNGVHVKVDGHIHAERLEKLLGVVN